MIELLTQMVGRYRMVATNARTGRQRVLAEWFPNLITNGGLDAIGVGSAIMTNCVVGTGSTTPSFTDSSLVAQVATTASKTNDASSVQPSATYYGTRLVTWRFGAGVAAGNLAEVGVKAANGTLFSRALILDGGGSPTTITVLSDEFLDVTYEFRIYPPLVDGSGTIDISGDSYDFDSRAAQVTGGAWSPSGSISGGVGGTGTGTLTMYTGALGAITAQPAGTSVSKGSPTQASYTTSNYYRDGTFSMGLADGNIGGIRSAMIGLGNGTPMGAMQFEFDPIIPKDGTKVLTLSFRHSWARKTL